MEKQNGVIEEPASVTITASTSTNTVSTETINPPVVTPDHHPTPPSPPSAQQTTKPKRVLSEKQKLNYLAANARRVQILADAKKNRELEASEKERERAACQEYALALRLAGKYGFTVPSQLSSSPSLQQANQSSQPPLQHLQQTYPYHNEVVQQQPQQQQLQQQQQPPAINYYTPPARVIRYG
ncbi:hypothetical protein T492DRAFT_850958 [Pavlovales sp. CCMP2436]|nr:hypothetical protein T492DRAFT_850958 [Pavlovales sp. CCMP2436]